jgi:hypothetical protein
VRVHAELVQIYPEPGSGFTTLTKANNSKLVA